MVHSPSPSPPRRRFPCWLWLVWLLAAAVASNPLARWASRLGVARLPKAYSSTYEDNEPYSYAYDTAKAEAWAEKAIADYSKELERQPALGQLQCSMLPKHEYYVSKLKDYLRTTALTSQDGLRVVLSDFAELKKSPLDILLNTPDESEEPTWLIDTPPTKPSPGLPIPIIISGLGLFAIIVGILCALISIPHTKEYKPQINQQKALPQKAPLPQTAQPTQAVNQAQEAQQPETPQPKAPQQQAEPTGEPQP